MNQKNKFQSLCPHCLQNIEAELIEENGKILLRKNCSEHGDFEDVYYGNTNLYNQYMQYFKEGNNNTNGEINCPSQCGLCENHKSSTILANIDITNDCNFRCPTCFANSNVVDYKYFPSFETILKMMDTLRNLDPPCEAIQFSGGEPSMRDDFFDLVKMARKKGFIHIQMATNGKALADDPDFARNLFDADLDTVYLQFDGVTAEPYKALRGFNALPIKLKAIENLRKNGRRPFAVLVPTLVKGINDSQVGEIVRFAFDNIDVVRGVNFQPVAFTGRIQKEELLSQRITIAELLSLLEEQTEGEFRIEDFLPVTAFNPFIDFLKKTNPESKFPKLCTHPACGAWSFAFKDKNKLIPLARIINLKEFLKFLQSIENISKTEITVKIAKALPKLLLPGTFKNGFLVMNLLKNLILKRDIDAASNFSNNPNSLFIGAMHFMDPYNFDQERVERCCIHNVTPNGSIIPFCSYNIFYRKKIEQNF
jgi:tetraether lipid synthase